MEEEEVDENEDTFIKDLIELQKETVESLYNIIPLNEDGSLPPISEFERFFDEERKKIHLVDTSTEVLLKRFIDRFANFEEPQEILGAFEKIIHYFIYSLGDMELAYQTLLILETKGITPSFRIYSSLIHGYAQLNDIRMIDYLSENMKRDVGIDINTFNLILGIYMKNNIKLKPDSVFKSIKENGLTETLDTFNILLKSFILNKKSDSQTNFGEYGDIVINRMKEINIIPDDTTFDLLIQINIDNINKVHEIVQLMEEYDKPKTDRMLELLIQCYRKNNIELRNIYAFSLEFKDAYLNSKFGSGSGFEIFTILIDKYEYKKAIELVESLLKDESIEIPLQFCEKTAMILYPISKSPELKESLTEWRLPNLKKENSGHFLDKITRKKFLYQMWEVREDLEIKSIPREYNKKVKTKANKKK